MSATSATAASTARARDAADLLPCEDIDAGRLRLADAERWLWGAGSWERRCAPWV
jgi:hypothetical protein